MQLTDNAMKTRCRVCGVTHILMVNLHDVGRWQNGALIQDAMPYLSANERELLISRTCGKCFDKMFGGEE